METIFTKNPKVIADALEILKRAVASEEAALKSAPNMSVEGLVSAYANCRDFYETMDEVVKSCYHIMNAYKESVLPTRMVEQGIKTASTNSPRNNQTTLHGIDD